MLFLLPVEAQMVRGLDTTDLALIERYADLVVDWFDYRPSDDDAHAESALGTATRRTAPVEASR